MSTSLRATSSIARLSRKSIRLASPSRSISHRSLLRHPAAASSICQRTYATKRSSPKGKAEKDGESPGNAPKTSVNKSAPGMEHVYNSSSPLSNPEGKTESVNSVPSKLSEEDEKTIREMTELLGQGMPKSQREEWEKAVQAMRKEGIPEELKEVMKNWSGELNIATAATIIRIISRLSRKGATGDGFGAGQQNGAPQQKAGVHDPGPQDGSSKSKSKKTTGPQGFFGGGSSGGGGGSNGPTFFGIKWDIGNFLTSAFVAYMVWRTISPGENSRDITWQEFRTQYLDKGLVEKLAVVNLRQVKVYLNRDAVRSTYPDSPASSGNFYYYFSIGDVASFERHLDQAQFELGIPSNQRIPVAYDNETPWLATLFSFGPTLLLIGSTFWLFRRTGGGAGGGGAGGIFSMGRSRAKKFNHETDIKIGFKDVAGMDEAKLEIMEFVSFLKDPGMYQKLGAKIPRGAILSGPPGTGKTLLAKATAGESKVPFFSVSGSEFVEMFVGVGASRVRDMFQNARKSAPCIIFIDEIDAIGKQRGKSNFSGGSDEREVTLNQILTEMDGFNTSEQVVVLAGTNRADVLDKALMRPGRFDRHIAVDRPTMEGRKQIFAVHLKKITTHEEPEHLRGRLAALTPGFAGADIANCCNEAALIAARRHADSVVMKDFEDAIERVIGGLEKKSLVLKPEEKRVVAYHEAGHAICGWYFKYADPLLKVSIIPRGSGALGYAQYLPSGESYLLNVNQIMDRMAMTLAGRVSEELHFDTVTSGASDDFNKVTRMATAMVTKWGMSKKVGYLYFEDDPSSQLHKPFSEETARNIDSEVKRIVEEAYKQCRELLVEKKAEIGLVAEELLKLEVLSRDDLVRLLGKRPFETDEEFEKYFGSKGDREGVEGSTPETGPGLGGGEGVGPAAPVISETTKEP